jgi:hypothetical protein
VPAEVEVNLDLFAPREQVETRRTSRREPSSQERGGDSESALDFDVATSSSLARVAPVVPTKPIERQIWLPSPEVAERIRELRVLSPSLRVGEMIAGAVRRGEWATRCMDTANGERFIEVEVATQLGREVAHGKRETDSGTDR